MLVQITVSPAILPTAIGAMREWLDRSGCPDTRFETATPGTDDKGPINVEFGNVRPAIGFCRAFDPLAAAA